MRRLKKKGVYRKVKEDNKLDDDDINLRNLHDMVKEDVQQEEKKWYL